MWNYGVITWSPRYSKFRGFANKPCGCKERRLSREADSHKRAACAWGERSLPFRPAPRGLHMGRFLAGFGPGSVQAPIASGNRKQRYPRPCCREVAFPGTEQGAAEVARIGCAPCRPGQNSQLSDEKFLNSTKSSFIRRKVP